MTEAATRGGIIRARRYVSAPAGCYPAPVPPRPPEEQVAAPGEPEVPTGGVGAGGPGTTEVAAAGAAAAPMEAVPGPPAVPVPRREGAGSGPGWGGLLLGAAVGAVIGVSLGLILVAFFGGCEPSLAWTDPLAVWDTVTDPVLRFSGLLVATGCTLLGAALGARRPTPPPED